MTSQHLETIASATNHNPARAPVKASATLNSPSFTAASTQSLGLNHFLAMPVVLIGLGTHGCVVVRRVIDALHQELGRVPEFVKYLLLDCKAMPHDRHRQHSIPMGVDGAGTNPHEGLRRFESCFLTIKRQLMRCVDDLFSASDPLLPPALPPRKAVAFFDIGTGFGGSSGGMLHPMISLEHFCAQQRNIEEPRVHVNVISPDVLLRDNTKQIQGYRRALIENTYAENVDRILGEAQMQGEGREELPDGTAFHVEHQKRVFSLHKAGQTNGVADLTTSEQSVAMIADTLYLYLFTQAGHVLDQHICDIYQTQRLFASPERSRT